MVACEHVRDRLVAFDDQELDSTERGQIQQHIAACPQCAGEMAELRGTMDLLSDYLNSPFETAAAVPVPAESAFVRRRSRISFRGLAVAASVLLVASAGVLTLLFPKTSLAQEVMASVVRRLVCVMNFSARFECVYAYAGERPGGYVSAVSTGVIYYAIQPARKLRVEESWTYSDAAGREVREYAEQRTWAHAGGTRWDRTRASGSETFSMEHSDFPEASTWETDPGRESVLPPSPRRAAYELSWLLRGLSGERYRKWFGKNWVEAGVRTDPADGSVRVAFKALSGYETWELTVITSTAEEISAIEMSQTQADSQGRHQGTIRTRYTIQPADGNLDDALFEVPVQKTAPNAENKTKESADEAQTRPLGF